VFSDSKEENIEKRIEFILNVLHTTQEEICMIGG
jgi:hypothetical protein